MRWSTSRRRSADLHDVGWTPPHPAASRDACMSMNLTSTTEGRDQRSRPSGMYGVRLRAAPRWCQPRQRPPTASRHRTEPPEAPRHPACSAQGCYRVSTWNRALRNLAVVIPMSARAWMVKMVSPDTRRPWLPPGPSSSPWWRGHRRRRTSRHVMERGAQGIADCGKTDHRGDQHFGRTSPGEGVHRRAGARPGQRPVRTITVRDRIRTLRCAPQSAPMDSVLQDPVSNTGCVYWPCLPSRAYAAAPG